MSLIKTGCYTTANTKPETLMLFPCRAVLSRSAGPKTDGPTMSFPHTRSSIAEDFGKKSVKSVILVFSLPLLALQRFLSYLHRQNGKNLIRMQSADFSSCEEHRWSVMFDMDIAFIFTFIFSVQ